MRQVAGALAAILLLASFRYGEPHVAAYVAPEVPEAGAADRCAHLYNVGRSRDWQNCMGVGPK